jgi:Holliday junction resolvase RusA-like endonuclease
MNELNLLFPVKCMSVNHYRQIRAIKRGVAIPYKTAKGRAYDAKVNKILIQNSLKIHQFFLDLDDNKEWVSVELNHYHSDLFTKKKTISSKCIDVDNGYKTVQDLLFKFAGKNDKCVKSIKVEKFYSKEDYFEVKILRSQYPLF